MTLEYVQGAADRIRLVAGRMPEERDEIVPLPFRLGQPKAPLVEVAVPARRREPAVAPGRRRALSGAGLRGRPRRRGSAQRAADDRRRGDRDLRPRTDADAAWLDDARLGGGHPRHGPAPLRLRLRPLRAVGLRRGGGRDGSPAAALLLALRRGRERLRRGHDRPAGLRRAQAGREPRGVDVRPAARDWRTHRPLRGADRLPERPGRGRRRDRDRRGRPPGTRARRCRPSRRPGGEPPRREHRARPLARGRIVAGAWRRGGGRDRGRPSGRSARVRARPRAPRRP